MTTGVPHPIPSPTQTAPSQGRSARRKNLRYSPHHAGYLCDWQRLPHGVWHNLLLREGAHLWDVYNRTPHARQIIPGREGLMKELDHLLHGVTLWGVHVEHQVQIKGENAPEFIDFVVSREVETEIPPGACKYVALSGPDGGIYNDPVLLRPTENEFWLSISDSNVYKALDSLLIGFNQSSINGDRGRFLKDTGDPSVQIKELDVAPVQIQGPKSPPLMKKLFGKQILDIPYYSLQDNQINGLDVTISRTGFSNVPGFEIYLHDATKHAESFWFYILEQGEEFGLQVIAPSHPQRLATGILSWGQDMDWNDTVLDSRLEWQFHRPHDAKTGQLLTDTEEKKRARSEGRLVYHPKAGDFLGKEALTRIAEEGVSTRLVGLKVKSRKKFLHYDDSRDYLWVLTPDGKTFVGYVTSIFWHPVVGSNLAFARISTHYLDMKDGIRENSDAGTEFKVVVPYDNPEIDECGNVDPNSLYLADAHVAKVPFSPKQAGGDLKKYV